MPVYSRSIGTTRSNAFPAWRAAMSAADTLYYVGTSTPENAPALPGMPTQFGASGAGNFGAGWDVMSGYSSGTLIESLGGAFGSMVYGVGGHTRLQNQLLRFDLNQDDPTFSWWQQPTWVTSDTAGADLYYSPSEAAALVAGPRGTAARIRLDTNETADGAAWDRQFPVAANGWIFPRKMVTGQMGNGVPHGHRYHSTTFVPSEVTGGDPLYLAILGPQGPFAQSYMPDGVTDAEWFDASALLSGSRRWPYHFKNVRTGAWTVHQWQPPEASIGGFGGPKLGLFRDLRRVYFVGAGTRGGAGSSGFYHWQFTDSGHTVSSWTGGQLGVGRYASGAWSDGDPLGRHFAIFPSDQFDGRLVVYNFDAGTSFYVNLAPQGYSHDPNDEQVGFSYDAANRRVFIVRRNNTTFDLGYWVVTVPNTLTDTAAYVATFRTLALSDPAMESSHLSNSFQATYFYNKTRFHPGLGVILLPFAQVRQLAIIPS